MEKILQTIERGKSSLECVLLENSLKTTLHCRAYHFRLTAIKTRHYLRIINKITFKVTHWVSLRIHMLIETNTIPVIPSLTFNRFPITSFISIAYMVICLKWCLFPCSLLKSIKKFWKLNEVYAKIPFMLHNQMRFFEWSYK